MEGCFYDRFGMVLTTKGSLPHWHQTGKMTFVTFRLGDSIPQNVLDEILLEYELKVSSHKDSLDKKELEVWRWEKYNRIEKYLDRGMGECLLENPQCRDVVAKALLHFDDERYKVFAFVIMPNHVHVLMMPLGGWVMQDIMKSIKHYSALQINKLLGRNGNVWQRESFDRIVRDEEHYMNILKYIYRNPRLLERNQYTLYFAEKLM